MYKVLVFGVTENPGGVESVIINYYRCIDRSKIQFDFLCNFHGPAAYEEELKALGAEVYHITARSADYRRYKKELESFFASRRGVYEAIWVNVCSLANIDYLIMAKKYGIPRRIIHSHNSQNMDSRLRGLLHARNKNKLAGYATDFWSCSDEAAKWFYVDALLPQVVIIKNAICVKRMAFDEEKRSRYRRLLGCGPDACVIGNIGRLHFQKNQRFCIRVFWEFHRQEPDARLVLIGQGEDEEMLREEAERLGLSDAVYFAGTQSDVAGWLSAFDIFLFPSRFEGLGLAAVEAQASGLPILASAKVIPEEVKINENIIFFDLNRDARDWSGMLIRMRARSFRLKRGSICENFKDKGYSIEEETKKLERLFLEKST